MFINCYRSDLLDGVLISLEATTGTTISAGKIRKKVSNAEQTNRDRKGYVNSDCG